MEHSFTSWFLALYLTPVSFFFLLFINASLTNKIMEDFLFFAYIFYLNVFYRLNSLQVNRKQCSGSFYSFRLTWLVPNTDSSRILLGPLTWFRDAHCAALSMATQFMRMWIKVGAAVMHHKCIQWKFGLCQKKNKENNLKWSCKKQKCRHLL